jgi:hypothetical protein
MHKKLLLTRQTKLKNIKIKLKFIIKNRSLPKLNKPAQPLTKISKNHSTQIIIISTHYRRKHGWPTPPNQPNVRRPLLPKAIPLKITRIAAGPGPILRKHKIIPALKNP